MEDSLKGVIASDSSSSLFDSINEIRKVPTRLPSLNALASGQSKRTNTENTSYTGLCFKRKLEDDLEGNAKKKENLDSSLCVSPWEFRRIRADLMESQAQIIRLEDRIDQLHKKNKEAVIFFDKEKSEMKSQLESNRSTIKDLEYRLNVIRKRESECREELTEAVKIHEIEKLKTDERILELENENEELRARIFELESASKDRVRDLQSQVQTLTGERDMLKLKEEENEEMRVSLEARLAVALQDVKDTEELQQQLQNAQLKIKELESEVKNYEESKQIALNLKDRVFRLPELEKELLTYKTEIANLRQSIHNKVLLEEMVHDLKIKLAAIEDEGREIPILKAKILDLESELNKWLSLAADFSSQSTREALRDYIESLQRTELTSSLEMNNLNASVRSSEKAVTSLQSEIDRLRHSNERLEAALQKLKLEVQVLRKKSILVTRERDSYREQLDLYERDLTMTGISSESINNEMCSQLRQRIQGLESSMEEYRKHVSALEAQIKEYQTEDTTDHLEVIRKLKEDVCRLEESNKTLSNIRDDLEKKLELRAVRGEYLSPNTKVLHFRMNPATLAEQKHKEDMNSLKEECERLRSRVKLLEAGECLDITQKVVEDVRTSSSKRVEELEKELESTNLKMRRLKEVFKKTSQEFRDVSYMLLGYQIDLASNKLYKLINMYSASPGDHLMFQQTRTGVMEMLGTPFAESLPKLIDKYLHKGNSIPAFLSAVTLSLHAANNVQSDEDDDEDDEEDDDDDEVVEDDRDDDDDDENYDENDDDDGNAEDDDEDDDDDNDIQEVRSDSPEIID